MGKFAKIAARRLANGDLKARLCEISWMARKRFWFAVAPTMYAVPRNVHDRTGVCRSRHAAPICTHTTASTTYFVRGSGPQSLRTYSRGLYVTSNWSEKERLKS